MPGPGAPALRRLLRPKAALVPLVRHVCGDILCQVHPLQAGEFASGPDGLLRVRAGAGQDATALGALVPDDSRELARVDIGDRDGFAAAQVVVQTLLRAPVADGHGEIADDQAGGVDPGGLEIRDVGAGVADMGIGQRDDLAKIGGIVEDLLGNRSSRC